MSYADVMEKINSAVGVMANDVPKYIVYVYSKDVVLIKCTISCIDDIIVDNVIQYKNTFINSFNVAKILNKRCSIINRYGITKYLKELGILSKLDLLKLTHGVSLTDCLWMRFDNENIEWKDVNPYGKTHAFDINWFIDSSNPIFKKVLPNYSTDGQFAKCWESNQYGNYLIKAGSSGAYNAGLEPLSEILFTQIAKSIDYTNIVTYDKYLIDYTGTDYVYKQSSLLRETICYTKRLATRCKAFTNEEQSLITARELGLTTYDDCIKFAKEYTSNVEDLYCMLVCDCIGFNTDRHMGNIGFLYYPDSMNIFAVAPMYDNNMSLLCYWDDREDIRDYAFSLRAKDGSDFADLAKHLLSDCSWLKSKINNAEFSLSSDIIISDRTEKLMKIVRENVKRFL